MPLSSFLQPDFVVHREADNTAGTIQYTAAQMSPSPPVTGSGFLAQIRFMPLREGQFTMTFVKHELSDLNGVLIPHIIQQCTVGFFEPTAVTLAGFTATQQEGDNLIAWETASEIDTLGFNVYRSVLAAGSRTVLNDSLILAQTPGVERGASYSWLDPGCTVGATDLYWLETVSLDGQKTFHGPVSASCAGPTAVSVRALHATRQRSGGLPAAAILVLTALSGVLRLLRAR